MPRVFEYDVFLSFSSDDEKIAKPIWQELCLNGLRVFWSDSMLKNKLGESWFDAIESSLESSQHFVLLCSPNSMSSEWVKREYKAFLNHCYKAGTRKLIPVLVGNYKVSSLPLFLREFEACRLDERNAIKKLVSILGGIYIEELRTILANKNEENNLLREELSVANSRIASLRQDVIKLSIEISNLKNENNFLKQQLSDSDSKRYKITPTLGEIYAVQKQYSKAIVVSLVSQY